MVTRVPTRLLATMLMSGITPASNAAGIVRHSNPPPAIILGSVTLPPGSEILMLSGQVASPIDPAKTDGIEAFGNTRTQTVSVLNKIKAALTRLGYGMADVVKLTVFIAGDPKLGGKMDFAGFNDGYRQFFGTPENPNLVARSTVQVVALADPAFLIEIEATAAKTCRKAAGIARAVRSAPVNGTAIEGGRHHRC